MTLLNVGNVIEMFYSTNSGRVNTTALTLDSKGVLEDKYYNKNIDRSVLITSLDSYKIAKDNGIDVAYNALGENLLIDYNPYHLKPGTQLKVGDVLLEISQNCTLCNSLANADTSLPKLLKDDRGIFARVIKGGTIEKSDNIYLLTKDLI